MSNPYRRADAPEPAEVPSWLWRPWNWLATRRWRRLWDAAWFPLLMACILTGLVVFFAWAIEHGNENISRDYHERAVDRWLDRYVRDCRDETIEMGCSSCRNVVRCEHYSHEKGSPLPVHDKVFVECLCPREGRE